MGGWVRRISDRVRVIRVITWDDPAGKGLEAVALAMLRLENNEHLG